MLFSYQESFDMPSTNTSSTNMPSTTSSNLPSGSSKLPGTSAPSIGKYQYLAPPPSPNEWTPDIATKFVNRYNMNLERGNESEMIGPSNNKDKTTQIIINTLEEEAVYYITNGKFPINTYITDFLDANPTAIPSTFKLPNGTPITSNNISTFYPNRIVFAFLMYKKEVEMNPPSEALQIFRGLKPPPNPSESKTSLSSIEFEQLKSICRNIK